VVIFRGEDGYWWRSIQACLECLSQGKTKEEAVTNIREAIRGYIAALEENKLAVPEERFVAVLMAV
jgi:predicted RNase H-like HicB family nuclease